LNFVRTARTTLRANWSVIAFIAMMLMFRSALADWMVVPSGSMNPTIVEGDRVLVNKLVFGLRVPFTTLHLTAGENPARGDIVVFDSPNSSITLIKRVIGLPGDVIEMRDEQVSVNHQALAYTALAASQDADMLQSSRAERHQLATELLPGKTHAVMALPDRAAMRDFGPLVVPPGQYFMMGDNRDNSEDSRFIGSVPRRLIVGRASKVLVSLNPEHDWLPRTDRFLKPLDD
jgi:signal peptidase I